MDGVVRYPDTMLKTGGYELPIKGSRITDSI